MLYNNDIIIIKFFYKLKYNANILLLWPELNYRFNFSLCKFLGTIKRFIYIKARSITIISEWLRIDYFVPGTRVLKLIFRLLIPAGIENFLLQSDNLIHIILLKVLVKKKLNYRYLSCYVTNDEARKLVAFICIL